MLYWVVCGIVRPVNVYRVPSRLDLAGSILARVLRYARALLFALLLSWCVRLIASDGCVSSIRVIRHAQGEHTKRAGPVAVASARTCARTRHPAKLTRATWLTLA
jgi:hypothetical protein